MKAVTRWRVAWFSAVVFVSLLMTWPAIYNGFPLLYPDSMSYLESGRYIARGLFAHDFPTTYTMRSAVYGLTMWPLHWNVTVWPIVGFNALMVAYVLWLVTVLFVPEGEGRRQKALGVYLGLGSFLGLFSGVAWYVGYVMPDIFGPVVYLSFFLIAFGREKLSRVECWTLAVIAWWGITAHSTHLPMAGGLCVLISVALWLQSVRGEEPGATVGSRWLTALGWLGGITLAAAVVQLGLNCQLYGKPSLNGRRPPFLLARVVADGPGRWYLQEHCRELRLPPFSSTPNICRSVDQLPDNVADFLWSPRGLWFGATTEDQDELRQEELPIVMATIRQYPREELRISAAQFWGQFNTFGLYNYASTPFILKMFESELPHARAHYDRSRQALGTLPTWFFSQVQVTTIAVSLVVIAIVGWRLGRSWPRELVGLAVVIAYIVIANAALTGVFSNIEDRYQGRVIWLVPLLAGLVLVTWLGRRPTLQVEAENLPEAMHNLSHTTVG
jgi:hypothetical protein